ncbi:MAG: NAD(P)/FAD-dependent oxidoreductase [Bacillota bacterium]
MKKLLIIGGGIAGLNAAKTAREADNECEIIILESDNTNTYIRTRLPEYISGEIDKASLFPYSDEWYKDNRIKLINNHVVTAVDVLRRVVLTSRESFQYDSLVIAAGSNPFKPDISGIRKANIFSVRTIEDSELVRKLALSEERTVCTIIGGGLLGLEMAWAVKQLGCNVNVVEYGSRLLPRQMDELGSGLLLDAIKAKGINVYLNAQTEEFIGHKEVEAVRFKNGAVLKTDFVLLSTGVRANIAPYAGIVNTEKAIVIDDFCETSVPGIYAAGDAAQHEESNFCIWPVAIAQGKVAGHNAVSFGSSSYKRIRYNSFQPFTNLKIKGITAFSIGDIADENCEILHSYNEEAKKYIKLYIRNCVIVAAIVFGDSTTTLKIKKAVDQKKPISSCNINEILDSI